MGRNRKKRTVEEASHSENDNGGESSKHVEKSSKGRQIGSFKVLEITYNGKATHYSYMRAHDGQDDRTMFLVNLPVDTTEKQIKSVFQDAGIVQNVQLWKGKQRLEDDNADDQAPKIVPLGVANAQEHLLVTATSAHVTFLDASSLNRALGMTRIDQWPESNQSLGLDFLIAQHRALRPDLDNVKSHADSVIAQFEWRKRQPKAQKSGGIQVASIGANGELLDEDGFTIVQGTGKYGRTADQQGSSVRVSRANTAAAEPPLRKKPKRSVELEDFYRFQRREAKRQELAQLRADFASDQEKIRKLKQNKRTSFKPF